MPCVSFFGTLDESKSDDRFFLPRYEGTGRSLSLKLIQQLREQSAPLGSSSSSSQSANKGSSSTPLGRTLNEITLNESIRYAPGDEVERWLNHLLCLDATVVQKLTSGCPLPENCDLYPFGVPWWCYFFLFLNCIIWHI